jgi:hypothetical protein
MAQTGKSRQSMMAILTVAITLILLSAYFFVYVKNKEAYINQRNFHALARTAHNLDAKFREFTDNKIVANVLVSNLESVCIPWHKNNEIFLARLAALIPPGQNIKIESANDISRDKNKNTITDMLENGVFRYMAGRWNLWTKTHITIKIRKPDFSDCRNTKYEVNSYISADDFIASEIHQDFFSNYIILGDFGKDSLTVIYEKNPLGLTDTLKKTLIANQIAEVKLNGRDFKTFTFPFLFSGEKWWIIGIQQQSEYLDETRSFDRGLLYVIVLVTLLLVLALPMIKIVFISKNEKLNKGDVTLTGLSLLLGCYFCSLMILRLDYRRLYDERQIETLAGQIEKNFDREIRCLWGELKHADDSLKGPADFNRTKVNFIVGNSTKKSDSCAHYYGGTRIFYWVDNEGMQQAKWTTGAKLTKMIPVRERAYLRARLSRRCQMTFFGSTILVSS